MIDGAETLPGAPGGTAVPKRCEVSLLQIWVALPGRLLQVARSSPLRRPSPQWTLARTQAGDGRTRPDRSNLWDDPRPPSGASYLAPRGSGREGGVSEASGRAGGSCICKKRWRLSSPGFICCLSPGPGVSRESNGRG